MRKILYAEDDPQVADLVRLVFAREEPDYAVDVVGNGRDCLERMAAGGYDLLLLDLVLPGRDGLKVLSELAQRGDSTPVVVISSHGQYEQTVSAFRAGALDCIDKKSGRFLQIARIVRGYVEGPMPREEADAKSVLLLETSSAAAAVTLEILRRDAPGVRVTTVGSRPQWDRLVVRQAPMDALVMGDDWALVDVVDVFRDFRTASRGGPAILVSRKNSVEAIVAAHALGCRDCIVEKHGYQSELARSLNHLLRPQPVAVAS